MASNYTENFELNQWDLSDNLLMAEFNADNAKIETALTELKTNMPHVYAGNYVGTGTYGKNNPNTLTFDFTPKLLIMSGYANSTGSFPYHMIAVYGTDRCEIQCDTNSRNTVNLIWGENFVSWYHPYGPRPQMNESGWSYHYVVIG